MSGNSGGVNDEPNWEEHIAVVIEPPKSRRLSPGPQKERSPQSSQSGNSNFEMMMALEAKRSETLQSAIMIMLAQSTALQLPRQQTTGMPAHAAAGKALAQMTEADCRSWIESIQLPKYVKTFSDSSVYGPMLEAFIHPQFGRQLLMSTGISEEDCISLVPEIYRLKACGFNRSSAISV
ncbi:uncharacterized protein LOC125573846 [Nematostella vectensis]|uniref:uncharacterized protein LOC125573846 n=1 Tax=Nematostella vectensis TaxID=45351 RepID=UPI0020775CC6|nr:uncharacterized protein LOC125573846 [Nematostella vectensis]